MTMLPGQPRRPLPPTPPAGWTQASRQQPAPAWTGLPPPQRPVQPRTPAPAYDYTPARPVETPAAPPAPPRGAGARFLRGNAKVIATVIGLTLTLLTMIDGMGFVPADARDIVAVMLAGLTPIAVYFLPQKGDSHGNET